MEWNWWVASVWSNTLITKYSARLVAYTLQSYSEYIAGINSQSGVLKSPRLLSVTSKLFTRNLEFSFPNFNPPCLAHEYIQHNCLYDFLSDHRSFHKGDSPMFSNFSYFHSWSFSGRRWGHTWPNAPFATGDLSVLSGKNIYQPLERVYLKRVKILNIVKSNLTSNSNNLPFS